MSAVTRGSYKDQDAVILENEKIRAVILPGWGAKTASLVHKGSGIETLWQTTSPAYRCTGYGDSYVEGEFSGFDEMFPTISRCFYETAPWAGLEVPDHGEVWTVPWDHAIEGDSLVLSVHGTRFPYRLQKTVRLDGERLIARYRADNLARTPVDFIWAAHPLFNACEGMQFIVPRGMDQVVNSVAGPILGAYGERHGFPLARVRDGRERRLDVVPPKNGSGWQKYWFASKVPEGWCMLHDPGRRLTIGMAFPKERVPWLGMWLNEGGYGGQYNIAPEPATAAMDRIDFSRMWGMESCLTPGEPYEWHLIISVEEGEKPLGMTPSGKLIY